MSVGQAEKMEIIRLVEESDLSVRRTLEQLGIHGLPSTTGTSGTLMRAMMVWLTVNRMPDGSGTSYLRR